MSGMTVYDMVRTEQKLALKGANRRHDFKVEPEPRRRLWRRRFKR